MMVVNLFHCDMVGGGQCLCAGHYLRGVASTPMKYIMQHSEKQSCFRLRNLTLSYTFSKI